MMMCWARRSSKTAWVSLPGSVKVTMPLRHWLLPLRVSLGIYREAVKLLVRRARFFPHPKRRDLRV